MSTQVLEKIGKISILKNGNSYLIRFHYQKKIYQLGRGKISKENLKATRAIASQINSDILFNRFSGLESYRQPEVKPEIKAETKSLKELWLEFLSYQNKFIKASTFRAYKDIERILEKINFEDNPKTLEAKLLKITTKEMTRRVLGKISQCLSHHDPANPKITELKKLLSKYTPSFSKNFSPPYCLSENEISLLRNSDKLSATEKLILEFWLNTGCRPSSVFAVQIDDIDLVNKTLKFKGSVQRNENNELFVSKGSKNNKFYSVPINDRLKVSIEEYLQGDYLELEKFYSNYLFWDFGNNRLMSLQTLRQRGFLRKIRKITGNDKIIFYNFRDTFISRNILGIDGKPKPIAVIAKWVDSSVGEIERKYFDVTKIDLIPE